MASVVSTAIRPSYGYPTGDGKPMAETDKHRKLMNILIETLDLYFIKDPNVYVSGNLLLFYEPGNKRRHLSPDVMFVRGVPKGDRLNYLTWIEEKGPDVVIELTSSSTRHKDTKKKFAIYRDTLRVSEYFLFDPLGDYLTPRLQGYRLIEGQYVAIEAKDGRLPSVELGLHLERTGEVVRLWDPTTETLLPTPAQQQQERADQQQERAQKAEDQLARALQELENLRRQQPKNGHS
jgi:Uma2 family endonuclease